MFLLVSGRHVGTHPDGHQHGVSIQISINLDKTFPVSPHILHLGESLCIFTYLLFQDSGFYLFNGFDCNFDLILMA